ncbi:MAG: fructosamine kinase family protein [Anaerolineales bacterium]|nr:fructosamine kinase family protein [Anaerolineales bacterium]
MKIINPAVNHWLLENQKGTITAVDPAGGGCIHQALFIRTESGESYFLKQNQAAPADMFLREEEGLNALRVPGGPVVPRVFLVGKSYLLLEDLHPAGRCKDFWQIYGRQLAEIHLNHHPQFGFKEDNYIGFNPQKNTWMDNGFDFFRENRLRPQIDLAMNRSLLDTEDLKALEDLLQKLPQIIPPQPASLIHGDLWSGNLITDHQGRPALIDPAVHYGWAEADLAMTDLFGRYPDEFFGAYEEVNPLESFYRSRFPFYNLYHLLNHLNLFGGGYLSRVRLTLKNLS